MIFICFQVFKIIFEGSGGKKEKTLELCQNEYQSYDLYVDEGSQSSKVMGNLGAVS